MALTEASMKEEVQAMKDFGFYDGVSTSGDNEHYFDEALPTTWVKRPQGTEARCRLVCKGCYQETADKDDTYASMPLLINLKLLFLFGLSNALCSYMLAWRSTSLPRSSPTPRAE